MLTIHNFTYSPGAPIDLSAWAGAGFNVARYHGVTFMADEVKKVWIDVSPDKRIETWANYVLAKCRNTGDTGIAAIEHESYTEQLNLSEKTQLIAIARAVRPGKRWGWTGYPLGDMAAGDPEQARSTVLKNDTPWPYLSDSAEVSIPYLYHPAWRDFTADKYRAACEWSIDEAFRITRPTVPVVPMFSLVTGGGERALEPDELRAVFGACGKTYRGQRVGGVALFAYFSTPEQADAFQAASNRAVKVLSEVA